MIDAGTACQVKCHTLKGALAPVKDSDQLLTSCSCLSQQCLTLYQGSPSTKIRQAWGRQHLALLAGGLLAGTSSAGHCSLLLAFLLLLEPLALVLLKASAFSKLLLHKQGQEAVPAESWCPS